MSEEEQEKVLQEKLKNMSPAELLEFQKQQCIFCQIIGGKIPSKQVYEDEISLGVLDINPASKGHILLLPKDHYAIMPQVPDAVLAHLFLVSKYISQILLKTLKVTGTNVFVANGSAAGQRAPHFMLHLIPRKEGDNLFVLPEKLIAKDLQQKVKLLVESRLNKILGVTKKEPEKSTAAAEKSKMPESGINNNSQQPERDSSSEQFSEQKYPAKVQKKTRISKSRKNPPLEQEDSSLDDIASLFN